MMPKFDACPLCGGKKEEGSTTFTVDLKETLVVVRDVPATLCAQCGNEWLSDQTASTLEKIVQDAKKWCHSVEVTKFTKAAQQVA